MNYDKIFDEDVETEFFYNKTGYPSSILVNGTISLKNAKERLKKGEIYILVKYHEGDVLPKEYSKLDIDSNEEVLFATIDKNIRVNAISINGGIQLVSKLSDTVYLLGPGPDKVDVMDLINEQIEEYKTKSDSSKMGR